LFLISGLLPVFSCVLIDKWLIINAIQFSGMHAISGGVSLSGPLIYLILLILLFWVVILVCCHIGFVFNFRFVSGVFMCFDR
jgi:cytosine/uracil/thiamine/allantoin permease